MSSRLVGRVEMPKRNAANTGQIYPSGVGRSALFRFSRHERYLMSVEKWLREYGSARARVQLARSEPGVGPIYAVEGEGTCFHVLGVGFFAFLPCEEGSLADLCEPLCRVPSTAVAVAGLVLAARSATGGLRGSVEGDSHV